MTMILPPLMLIPAPTRRRYVRFGLILIFFSGSSGQCDRDLLEMDQTCFVHFVRVVDVAQVDEGCAAHSLGDFVEVQRGIRPTR